ncbi:MAG: CapA family protein [Frisingicoccus sp.]|nr:CapA family protein [Frisingicoccus sp.]
MKRKKKTINRQVILIIAAIVVLLAGTVIVRSAIRTVHQKNEQKQTASSITSQLEKDAETDQNVQQVPAIPDTVMPKTGEVAENISITISAAGDCTLGKDPSAAYKTSLNAFYDVQGPSYFLSDVKDIFVADDLTIVNMEGTLTESENIVEKAFNFKADPEYAQILTEGSVEAVNLANNHSHDYSDDGYEDTIAALDGADIANFGYERESVMEIKGLKITLLGYNMLSDRTENLKQMKESVSKAKVGGSNLVIVSFHWGKERQYSPVDYQEETAHAAIDAGADLVLGHHPHVLQGIEKYNGRYICYSLGNFCFGGNKNPSDKDTMIFQQTFTFENGNLLDDDNINIIPCSLSSSSKKNDYKPRVLEGSEKERVMKKIEDMSDFS